MNCKGVRVPNLFALFTTVTWKVIPVRWRIICPVIHTRDVLPENEHLPCWYELVQADDFD